MGTGFHSCFRQSVGSKAERGIPLGPPDAQFINSIASVTVGEEIVPVYGSRVKRFLYCAAVIEMAPAGERTRKEGRQLALIAGDTNAVEEDGVLLLLDAPSAWNGESENLGSIDEYPYDTCWCNLLSQKNSRTLLLAAFSDAGDDRLEFGEDRCCFITVDVNGVVHAIEQKR